MSPNAFNEVTPTRTSAIRAMRVKDSGDPRKCPLSGCGAPGAVTVRYDERRHRMEAFCRACGEVLPGDDSPML